MWVLLESKNYRSFHRLFIIFHYAVPVLPRRPQKSPVHRLYVEAGGHSLRQRLIKGSVQNISTGSKIVSQTIAPLITALNTFNTFHLIKLRGRRKFSEFVFHVIENERTFVKFDNALSHLYIDHVNRYIIYYIIYIL